MFDLDHFNPPQREAILHGDGPLLVLAGAGSGKTRVIVHRIAHLMKVRGVKSHNILAVTFTNKAAGEMKERLESLLGCEPPHVSTFHSFCARVLREEIPLLGFSKRFTICDDSDCEKIIKESTKDLHLDPGEYKPAKVAEFIDNAKNHGLYPEDIDPYDWRQENLVKIYRKYQDRLKKANSVDFGDLLMFMAKIFEEHPRTLAKYQDRFHYMLVDEYQDTNAVQYKLVRQLASKHRNLCVVGDDDQSIYGWRGADLNNILGMERDFPDLHTVRLEQNYRCTKTILKAANTVIARNKGRKGKTLWTDNTLGDPILVATLDNERGEGQYVVEAIKGGLRAGRPLSEYAVLYRVNSLSRSIEEALLRAGLPYVVVGGFRFYDRAEVKDVLAYLRAITNPADDMAIRRIVNVPARGIGTTTINKLLDQAGKTGATLYQAMKEPTRAGLNAGTQKKLREFTGLMDRLIEIHESTPLVDFIIKVVEMSGYLRALEKEDNDEAESRAENVKELVSVVAEFAKGKDANEATVEAFIEHAALMSAADTQSETDKVTLMTMHSSKGLEFPEVFIVGVEEGLFPHSRAAENAAEMEEERRLCYVGITRAKKRLHLTLTNCRRVFGEIKYPTPSSFLQEIPEECMEDVEL